MLRRKFGILHNVLGVFDTLSTGYIIGQYAPSRPVPEHIPVYLKGIESKLELTTLSNGVRILTESEGLPSAVHLGVTIATGTRDETSKTSGIVHGLASTYLKTNIRTNEQINYGMVQMSGGEFKMTYSQDFMNYYGHCLAHDTYDILQMLSDCVLDEKTLMDEEALQWRIDEYWKLREVTLTNWKKLDEIWLSVAYGYAGYGMPLSGFQSNFQNLGYYYLNQWRKAYATPDRIIVWGAGIKSHSDFVNIVTPYFCHLDPVKSIRPPSKYIGGEYKELIDSSNTNISISFEGASRNSEYLASAFVLKYIIGKTQQGSLSKANKNFHEKYPGVEAVEADHAAFEDTGNFRVKLVVKNENVATVCEGFIKEFKDLANITEEEVTRAKGLLISAVRRRGLDPCKRMVKNTQMLAYTKKVTGTEDFVKSVEEVNKDKVKSLVEVLQKSFPTIVVIGGNPNAVPNAEVFHNKLR